MRTLIFLAAAALALASPALANHPGDNLDEAMASREVYFQAIDVPSAPSFELVDADGNVVRLADFSDKIVVLNFIFASCADVCPLHSDLIADIQKMVNATPMKDMVQFLTITTDPAKDTPVVLQAYGPSHGLDPYNWMFLTTLPDQPEDATRKLSETYNVRFEPLDDGQQMHGVVTHIIDRGGRFAAKFHGLEFDPVNLVLYVNGLTNRTQASEMQSDSGWWGKLIDLFQ